ncbi:DUF624 domain-containing protein [Fictibacillus enclensis]|uniref:YesL family protein n=1 Tax=Fictibacillus enclensis TaxID=1017270 RepID=UPI0025A2C09C|nr:DUF624 domain-containing protein [Fictibacillus enclensis]MDM5196672.1 DUF624 domain-containing protein [Fictibacillus enclensis]
MDTPFISNRILYYCEWMTKLVCLNLVWIGFTLLGGIILGIMPATASLFYVCRKWLEGKGDEPLLPAFWQHYRQEFWSSQFLIVPIIMPIGLILFNMYVLLPQTDWLLSVVFYVNIGMVFLYCCFLVFLFPLYTKYKFTAFKLIKAALIFGCAKLHYGLLLLITYTFIIGISILYSSLFFFFTFSGLALCNSYAAYFIFDRSTDV